MNQINLLKYIIFIISYCTINILGQNYTEINKLSDSVLKKDRGIQISSNLSILFPIQTYSHEFIQINENDFSDWNVRRAHTLGYNIIGGYYFNLLKRKIYLDPEIGLEYYSLKELKDGITRCYSCNIPSDKRGIKIITTQFYNLSLGINIFYLKNNIIFEAYVRSFFGWYQKQHYERDLITNMENNWKSKLQGSNFIVLLLGIKSGYKINNSFYIEIGTEYFPKYFLIPYIDSEIIRTLIGMKYFFKY